MKEAGYIVAYGVLIGLMAAASGIYVRTQPLEFFVFVCSADAVVMLLRKECRDRRVVQP